MPLRASVTRRVGWSKSVRYHLDGTYLMCEQDALGCWLVLDTRKPIRCLAGPFFRINQAKVGAERLAADKPENYRVKS